MTTISDIETMIESLTPEQIKAVLATTTNGNVRKVDTRVRERRIAITNLYFSVAPLPYKSPYEEYKDHSESIRQQCISGVDL
jgi:hypothetical protein